MTRMYSPDERMLAGEKRRKSIITDLKVYVGGVLVATLFVAIASDAAHAWLDVPTNGGTVRDAVLAAINIWGIV